MILVLIFSSSSCLGYRGVGEGDSVTLYIFPEASRQNFENFCLRYLTIYRGGGLEGGSGNHCM